jgi:Xaa-Pro aminopeptidase
MQQTELLALLQTRIKRVTDLIKDHQADALLVTRQINYRYLTNFTGEEAQLILTAQGDRVLFSDSRFSEQIKAQAPGEMTVIMRRGDWVVRIAEAFKKMGLATCSN